MGRFHYVCPPFCQHIIACRVSGEGPVDLRGDIIHESFLHPQTCISIGLIVSRRSTRVRSCRIVGAVTPDSAGTHAKLHVRIELLNGTRHLLNQLQRVVTSPVRFRGKPAAIFLEGLIVIKGRARRLSIEVIIELHTVNRIVGNDLRHDAGDPVPGFRNTGVKHIAIAGSADPVPVQHKDAGRIERQGAVQLGNGAGLGVSGDTIGIKPGVHLHAALVGLIKHKL